MLVKSPLYGDVSEKPMMGMGYPFFAGTLTFVRMIEMFVEILYHRFFSFGEDELPHTNT
jgi:zinc transporter ZupT